MSLALLLVGGIGIVLGMLGGGGSILAVPVFVYVLHADPQVAIAMSLPVVGFTSLVGAWGHWREGHLNLRPALLLGVVAMAGAYGGARASALVAGSMQLILLALVMMGAAILMMRPTAPDRPRAGATERHGVTGRSRVLMTGAGFAIGALTGFLGVGGGFLFAPALVLLARVSMKDAIGRSLLVIAMSSIAGLVGHAGRGLAISWIAVALFIVAASAGILAGVHVVRFIPQRTLQRSFGLFLLLIGGLMLYQNLAPVQQERASGHRVRE